MIYTECPNCKYKGYNEYIGSFYVHEGFMVQEYDNEKYKRILLGCPNCLNVFMMHYDED